MIHHNIKIVMLNIKYFIIIYDNLFDNMDYLLLLNFRIPRIKIFIHINKYFQDKESFYVEISK
jgi:hypothetical protein